MGNPKKYRFDLPAIDRPEPFAIAEEWYPGVKDHWEQSTTSRKYDPLTRNYSGFAQWFATLMKNWDRLE